MPSHPIPLPFFRPAEPIPESGIYRVFHGEHRTTHYVTLLKGEVFPDCKNCGSTVHFELVRSAPGLESDGDFHVRLYEVPHPADAARKQKAS